MPCTITSASFFLPPDRRKLLRTGSTRGHCDETPAGCPSVSRAPAAIRYRSRPRAPPPVSLPVPSSPLCSPVRNPNPMSPEIPCPFRPPSHCLAVVTTGLTGSSCTRGCLPFPPSPSVSRGRREPEPPPPLLLAAGHSDDQMAHRAAQMTHLAPLYRIVPTNSFNLRRNCGLHGFDFADVI